MAASEPVTNSGSAGETTAGDGPARAGPAGETTAGDGPGATRTRTVSSAGAELWVTETGSADNPTVVLVHGYPDTHAVWDEVVALLADRFHVVAYDVRGMGRSTAPRVEDGFTLAQLALDLEAVLDAVSPERPVHLVGHDWGAFQCWEALARHRLSTRIASFTAVAGPRIDDAGAWARRRLRPSLSGLAQIAGQARRSWYIAAAQLPGLPEAALRSTMERGWPLAMKRIEGIEPRPGHPAPTVASDATVGLALYRTNMPGVARRGKKPAPAGVPVMLIVPTRDRYISTGLYADAERWATRLWRRDIRAGHWVQRSHPRVVARHIAELVEHAEGASESDALRRTRWAPERRSLQRRLAVVTGSGSGIGRATALALAREGAEVIVADIDLESAAETVARAGRAARAHAIRVDVGDAEAMERFAETIDRDHGTPDIVVNNAGIGIGGPFLETTLADWERIMDINLWGVIHGSRLFARQMVEAGVHGQIVNVASAAAFTPSRMLPAYSTTKAAVLMLSECMRAELAGAGIGVTAICPGLVNTNIVRTAHIVGASAEEEQRLQRRGAQAYGLRAYPPERVAQAILGAVRTNPAIVAVTPEARALRALSRLAPGTLRALARLDPSRVR